MGEWWPVPWPWEPPALPAEYLPDHWADYPEAKWAVVGAWGVADTLYWIYSDGEPKPTVDGWNFTGIHYMRVYGIVKLPLGIDFRTVKVPRPEGI